MSCAESIERADWSRLLRERDRLDDARIGETGTDGEEWRELVPHLEECETCRRHAYALDPTLLFQRLPRIESDREEVEEMKHRVAVLRSARELERDSRSPRFDRRRAGLGVAAAILFLLVGVVGVGHGPHIEPIRTATAVAVGNEPDAAPLDESVAGRPLIEDLDLPAAQVVQWSGDEVSMVLVVDKRLDV